MNFETIQQNISDIRQKLGANCQLIIVSKYRSIQEITWAYQTGARIFAENRVQALLERKEQLPADIQWHMIGHLQKNKVKYIAPFISLIHAVDSEELLAEINKQAAKNNRTIKCLLQMHVAQEETKFGFNNTELETLLANKPWEKYANISIVGMMAMASNTDDQDRIKQDFEKVVTTMQSIKNKYGAALPNFNELSIGMSSDFEIAVAQGSTMVRIGSKVFE